MWRARFVWQTNESRADRGVLTLRGRGHLSGAAAGASPESSWCPLSCQTAQDQVCSESQVNLGPLWKKMFRNMRCFLGLMAGGNLSTCVTKETGHQIPQKSISWKLLKQTQFQKWSKPKERSPKHEVNIWPRCPAAETLLSCTSRDSTLTGSYIPL